MFIGAGFSKAVIDGDEEHCPLSWGELIDKVAVSLTGKSTSEILPNTFGLSYPEISSRICKYICNHSEDITNYYEAVYKFKEKICELTNWLPDTRQREKYGQYLTSINPSWIITTNYDLIIESILKGFYISLSPSDSLIKPNNITPIYHLHGSRINPDSIIVTQEDYISLFRPNE